MSFLFNTPPLNKENFILEEGIQLTLTQINNTSSGVLKLIGDPDKLSFPNTLKVYMFKFDERNNLINYEMPKMTEGWFLSPMYDYKVVYNGEEVCSLTSLMGWNVCRGRAFGG